MKTMKRIKRRMDLARSARSRNNAIKEIYKQLILPINSDSDQIEWLVDHGEEDVFLI